VCEYTLSTRTSRRVQWDFGIIRFAYTATTVTVVVVVTVVSAVVVSPIVDRIIVESYTIASIRSVSQVIYNNMKYTNESRTRKTHSRPDDRPDIVDRTGEWSGISEIRSRWKLRRRRRRHGDERWKFYLKLLLLLAIHDEIVSDRSLQGRGTNGVVGRATVVRLNGVDEMDSVGRPVVCVRADSGSVCSRPKERARRDGGALYTTSRRRPVPTKTHDPFRRKPPLHHKPFHHHKPPPSTTNSHPAAAVHCIHIIHRYII